MLKYKYGRRIVICKGRLRGEKGKMIGETNLNMEYRIIVLRDNPRIRDKIMGFYRKELIEEKDNG